MLGSRVCFAAQTRPNSQRHAFLWLSAAVNLLPPPPWWGKTVCPGSWLQVNCLRVPKEVEVQVRPEEAAQLWLFAPMAA